MPVQPSRLAHSTRRILHAVRLLGLFLTGSMLAELAVIPSDAASVTHNRIARTGDPAPGGQPGDRFGDLDSHYPVVNRHGDVAFIAPIIESGGGAQPLDAVFLYSSRGLQRLAQKGQAPPGASGPVLGTLSHLAINDDAEVAFFSDGPFGDALISNTFGTWRAVATNGTPIPNVGRFTHFISIATEYRLPLQFRPSGFPDLLFPAAIGGPPRTSVGLWTLHAAGLNPTEIMAFGEQAPGMRTFERIDRLIGTAMGAGPAERSVFNGFLFPSAEGEAFERNAVVWVRSGSGETLPMLRGGEVAPVPEPRRTYLGFNHVSVNGAGTICFDASLIAANQQRSSGVFLGIPGTFSAIALSGQDVFDRSGRPIGQIRDVSSPAINAAGQVAFVAYLGDGTALCRWSAESGVRVILQTGDTWPGAPDGWTFGRIFHWNLNASGRLAFSADTLLRGNVEPANGVWITDANDQPILVAQSGMPASQEPLGVLTAGEFIFLDPSQGRTGGQDGIQRVFSDVNTVAFSAKLPDGASAIYLSRLATDTAPPADESFALVPPTAPMQPDLRGSDPGAARLSAPTPFYQDAVLQARADKDWTGARLRFEVVENFLPDVDRLGLDFRSSRRDFIDWGTSPTSLQYLGNEVGTASLPTASTMEFTLNAQATTDAVRHLIRSLAYGSNRNFEDVLRANPRHVETNRVLQVQLIDSGGRSNAIRRSLEFPRTVGLAFEGHGINNTYLVANAAAARSITLRLQLQLSDGTRLTIGCQPETAAQVQWTPNSRFGNVRIHSDPNGLCAAISYSVGDFARYPSRVRLFDWEASHLTDYPKPFTDNFNRGPNICVSTFFSALLALAPGGSPVPHSSGSNPTQTASRRSLHGAPPPPPTLLPSDITSHPYALRDWMRRSEEGRRMIGLYERHTGEVVALLIASPSLLNDTLALILDFLPGLDRFFAGKGAEAVIRPDMVDHVNRVWDQLAAAGSPELRATLEGERARYNGLQDFSGRSFTEWGERLGWGAPSTPFVTVSSPGRDLDGFSVHVNRLTGLAYSLWRRTGILDSTWQSVTDAITSVSEYSVQLTDPSPAPETQFYQVRTAP